MLQQGPRGPDHGGEESKGPAGKCGWRSILDFKAVFCCDALSSTEFATQLCSSSWGVVCVGGTKFLGIPMPK